MRFDSTKEKTVIRGPSRGGAGKIQSVLGGGGVERRGGRMCGWGATMPFQQSSRGEEKSTNS